MAINYLFDDISSGYVSGLRLAYQRAWTGDDDGDGFALQYLAWLPEFWNIRSYFAAGGGIAIGDPGFLGYGVIANAGLSYNLGGGLFINGEIAPILQVNTDEHITHGLMSANLGIGFLF